MNLSPNLLLLAALAAALPCAAQGKLNVIATTADFASIAKEIGGDKIEITTLARPAEDPHFVEAKPNFVVKLNRADAVIEGGAELEIGWLPPLLENARNPRLAAGAPGHIACHQGIALLEVPATLDRAKGDIHAAGNPHFMVDPTNARVVARHIAESFCQIDPPACATYRANLKTFTDQLDARLIAWAKVLAPFKDRRLVAYHNSWPYFAQRFGVKIDLFLEPKPGIPPTPTHLSEVIKQMKAEKIRVILVEPFLNRKTAETVARATGAVVFDVAQFPGGVKGVTGGYLELFDYLVNGLAKALSEPGQ